MREKEKKNQREGKFVAGRKDKLTGSPREVILYYHMIVDEGI